MNGKFLGLFGVAALGAALCTGAYAQLPVLVDEDFSGGSDPLTYLYQDPAVSQDSYAYNAGTEDMGGIARRGQNAPSDWENGTAERAYVGFDATGYGNGDEFLDYTECFNFCLDFNISAAGAGPDERLMLGLWYEPSVAEADNAVHYLRWANRQHAVAVTIDHALATLKFGMFFGNGGNGLGKTESIDVTGADSLATDTDYRVCAHYRYDGEQFGQLFGEVYAWENNAWVLKWSVAEQVITAWAGNDVAVIDFNADIANRRFTKLGVMGTGNETWGASRNNGPTFTSDNWLLTGCNPIPEPGVMALFGFGLLCLLGLRRRK